MTASAYHLISKEVKNHIFRHNLIFRHICFINNSHWQGSGIVIFLCKYYIVISDKLVGFFSDVPFLLLALIFRASWETKKEQKLSYRKKYIEEFVWGTWLFWLHALLSMSLFVAFFKLSFNSFCSFLHVTYLLNGLYKDT